MVKAEELKNEDLPPKDIVVSGYSIRLHNIHCDPGKYESINIQKGTMQSAFLLIQYHVDEVVYLN